ncbi:Hypothetical predicted protein [Paramuricea clavata]|uniref:Uncharacterized protein n=1 Tax=Paramuricea clavata TaxID=317549 RepID=A0A6S7H9M4_PARCT|nr:Hypothetical predicted protein [Paramuricea clavata]
MVLKHNPEFHEGHKMGMFSRPLASAWIGVRRANGGQTTEEVGVATVTVRDWGDAMWKLNNAVFNADQSCRLRAAGLRPKA